MILKLINNKLESLGHKLVFQTLKDTIGLSGSIPVSSVVRCHINGLDNEYSFYLPFVGYDENGCTFSSKLIIPNKILNEMLNNKSKLTISFSCNSISILGECEALFNIDYMLLEKPNEEKSLQKQLNELAEAIHKGAPHPISDRLPMSKGMVPIATDNIGNYSWGFINKDFEIVLVNAVESFQELARQHALLIERVKVLEEKVILEKYDEYNIK